MPVVEKLAAVRRYRVGVPGLQSRRQCEAREGRALHGRVTIRARQVDHARQVGVCGTVATWSEKPVVAQVGDRVCGEVANVSCAYCGDKTDQKPSPARLEECLAQLGRRLARLEFRLRTARPSRQHAVACEALLELR